MRTREDILKDLHGSVVELFNDMRANSKGGLVKFAVEALKLHIETQLNIQDLLINIRSEKEPKGFDEFSALSGTTPFNLHPSLSEITTRHRSRHGARGEYMSHSELRDNVDKILLELINDTRSERLGSAKIQNMIEIASVRILKMLENLL